MSDKALQAFLQSWRKAVRTMLETDPEKILGSRHPAVAAKLDDTFPNPDIIRLYVLPLTSGVGKLQDIVSEQSLPNLTELTRLCETYFSWANQGSILAKFSNGVFPAILTTRLRDEISRRETSLHTRKVINAGDYKVSNSIFPSIC